MGTVLEDRHSESVRIPVSGAVLTLLDPSGKSRGQALSDSLGRFVLAPPQAGEYYLEAARFGYEPTRSPLLSLSMEGTATVDLMMTPAPIGLKGFEVTVEREAQEFLRSFGLSPKVLGNRWIDRRDIEAVAIRQDAGQVLQWMNIAGMRVMRPENTSPGSDDIGLCVSIMRGRTGGGADRCALNVLNGLPITGPNALAIDPDAIEAMAVLRPAEATTFFGTLGSAGALLIWTRAGRR
ncbi:MAG: carboxypeptidase regulatory-like domain-containing protein [Gemmatimonadota bacterium]